MCVLKCAALVIKAELLFQCGVSEESEAFENAKHSEKVEVSERVGTKKAKLSIMRSI